MYLSGLSGPIIAVIVDGKQQEFTNNNGGVVDAALNRGQAVNVHAERFLGGWLVNGCPINVYFGQGWLPGQQDALRSAGKTACLPMATVAPPVAGSSPTFTSVSAPDYGGGEVLYSRKVTSQGVMTPSAPIIIQTPAGPVMDFGLNPIVATEEDKAKANTNMIGIAIAAGLLFTLMGRK